MKFDKVGNVSNESVKKHTKKSWDFWIEALEKEGARNCTHQQIVQILKKKFKLVPWWRQEVARGFQIATGRRMPGQNLKGLYTLTVTKTISTTNAKLWQYLVSPERLATWLQPMSGLKIQKGAQFEVEGGVFGELRTFKKPRQLRFYWINEEWPQKTVVIVYLIPRPQKCLLAIGHEDLPSVRVKQEMREHWRRAIEAVATHFARD